jgi:ribonuclease VapC
VTVLDASAVLALTWEEPGQQRVLDAILAGAEMTAATFAEVASRYVLRGASAADVRAVRQNLSVPLVPIDEDLATRAALMAAETRRAGLSLGDRLCLALAQRSGRAALTADRAWERVAAAVGVRVEMIR